MSEHLSHCCSAPAISRSPIGRNLVDPICQACKRVCVAMAPEPATTSQKGEPR